MVAKTFRMLLATAYVILVFVGCTLQCGPGRSYGSRKSRKTTPLVFKQHVPNVSENTLGASGPSEGKITRKDPRFKDLVVNNNPNIVFKDEEGTGVDRKMSQRCKEKLDALAILVKNQWPGVRLRVIESWDDGGRGGGTAAAAAEQGSSGGSGGPGGAQQDSLHQEGRAVDVTTSDRDRSKYGMLARLAVNAGFDWVYYESRGHIHCSVRSDSSMAVQMGGCFSSRSTVQLSPGGARVPMSRVSVGDRVLSVDPSTGSFGYAPVVAFLHRSPNDTATVWDVETETGQTLSLTPDHLIFSSSVDGVGGGGGGSQGPGFADSRASYAGRLRPNASFVFVRPSEEEGVDGLTPVRSRVVRVSARRTVGLFAPVTGTGNVVVDGVVASCYALVDGHVTAHHVVAPLRLQYYVTEFLNRYYYYYFRRTTSDPVTPGGDPGEVEGVHWYARFLYVAGSRIFPSWFFRFSNELSVAETGEHQQCLY